MSRFTRFLLCALLSLTAWPALGSSRFETISLLPEAQRAFFQDGPSWLFSVEDRRRVEDAEDVATRQAVLDELLADPDPSTNANELLEAIDWRQRLVRQADVTYLDDRAKLLFLRGLPDDRRTIDCGWVFEKLEVWRYGAQELVLFEPRLDAPWRLWLPIDGKEAIYTEAMSQYLSAMERIGRGRRWDRKLCPEAEEVDQATGIDGLTKKLDDAPRLSTLRRYLEPPAELAIWAKEAASTSLEEEPEELPIQGVRVEFPARKGQRIVTRLTVTLPADAELGSSEELRARHFDIGMEGVLEEEEEIFDSFRFRFRPEAETDGERIGLVAEQSLRSGRTFVLRLRLEDQIGGAVAWRTLAFKVPRSPEEVTLPPVPEASVEAVAEAVEERTLGGRDSLILVPPPGDVVLGTWRAVAVVTGATIETVRFSVDDQAQMTRRQAPFTAEVRLARFPQEQIVRADGLDAKGKVVASDEVVLNRPLGALRVRIVEPADPSALTGETTTVRAEVVVPHEREVEEVEFLLGDESIAKLARPPWKVEIPTPATDDPNALSYVTAVAELDDGSRAEDVLFFSETEFSEKVAVDLVELYTTVQGNGGRLVRDLGPEDFEVEEDGREMKLTRFELVDDLPLMAGIAMDLSGSMANSIVEAERAALDFLRNVVTAGDRCFALGFADEPVMLMPPTDDVEAVAFSLEGLKAYGNTALYDALVHALYYFENADGRGVLVLLSDGEDTSSHLGFRDALEYARRSGVVIYTVALGVRNLDFALRDKLKNLAEETGGRTYFIDDAEELAAVYREIEEELRSQYLLAYQSDRGDDGAYRSVEVKVKGRGLTARTARGTY